MSCCPESITTFAGGSSTTVPYNGEFGPKPTVTVLYIIDGVWTAAGVFTQISLIGEPVTSVKVDHGGISTGIIKLS